MTLIQSEQIAEAQTSTPFRMVMYHPALNVNA